MNKRYEYSKTVGTCYYSSNANYARVFLQNVIR